MTRLQEIMFRWPALAEGAKPQAKDEFHALGRGLFAATAKVLHVSVDKYRIQNLKGSPGLGNGLGEVSFQGPGFFVFLSPVSPKTAGIMRTATEQDKYGIGPEHTNSPLRIESIANPTVLAMAIRALLVTRPRPESAP